MKKKEKQSEELLEQLDYFLKKKVLGPASVPLPVDGSQQEVHQQGGALSGVDGVGGGQALAELVEYGGHQVLQPRHRDAGVQLHRIQARVPHSLDHVVDVDQVH